MNTFQDASLNFWRTALIGVVGIALSLGLFACRDDSNAVVGSETASSAAAPYITLDPADATVLEGKTASFLVVASGTPPPTFVWQRRTRSDANAEVGWNNITGATSATYETDATTL